MQSCALRIVKLCGVGAEGLPSSFFDEEQDYCLRKFGGKPWKNRGSALNFARRFLVFPDVNDEQQPNGRNGCIGMHSN